MLGNRIATQQGNQKQPVQVQQCIAEICQDFSLILTNLKLDKILRVEIATIGGDKKEKTENKEKILVRIQNPISSLL